MPASSYQQQKLRVCEVCSAYLGIHDNDRRLADHFGGKLHLGFIEIRDKLADLTVGTHRVKKKPFMWKLPTYINGREHLVKFSLMITSRKRSLRQGNVFTHVCHSVHREGVPV